MFIALLLILVIGGLLFVAVSPKKEAPPKVVGYDSKGKLIYEKKPNKIDYHA
jgi:hypothetical protein